MGYASATHSRLGETIRQMFWSEYRRYFGSIVPAETTRACRYGLPLLLPVFNVTD